MKTIAVFFTVALLGCNGCRDKQDATVTNYEQIQRDLIESNRKKHLAEDQRIRDYCKARNWPVQVTATGLHYWIYEKGTGVRAENENVAVVSYTIELMDGRQCYEASAKEPSRFLIGKDNVESGLHEALLLMREGDKIKLVMPSHLAFGFTGDSDCIPQESTVIYDLQLIRLE
ncbi:MAG: FKBP-type peptidyl-prolyl cis-trans isomerase [Flavobacteriales bacterium]|jgi:FKBP-type peptidyl-prolyl cis-trans isomerase